MLGAMGTWEIEEIRQWMNRPTAFVTSTVPDVTAKIPQVHLSVSPRIPECDYERDKHTSLHQFVVELPATPAPELDALERSVTYGCAQFHQENAFGAIRVRRDAHGPVALELDGLMSGRFGDTYTSGVVTDDGMCAVAQLGEFRASTGIVATLAPLGGEQPVDVLHLYPSALHGLRMAWNGFCYPPCTRSDMHPLRRDLPFDPPATFELHLGGAVHRIAVLDVQAANWPAAPARAAARKVEWFESPEWTS